MLCFDLLKYVLDRLPEARDGLDSIAAGSGVSVHTIIKIQSGETANPRVETLKLLAEWLKDNNYRPRKPEQRAAVG